MSGEFEKGRAQVAALIEAARHLRHGDTEALATLRERLAEQAIQLVVAGEFKRGKSTLVNALVGADLLPSGVVPLTSVVTELRGGAPAAMTVRLNSGEVRSEPVSTLASYVTEAANPRNVKGVRGVTLTVPALDPWMHLVDTPGVGSVYEHNSDVTMSYLPAADAVIFVISADQPLSRHELAFLHAIRGHAGKVFVAFNKVDHLTTAERAQSRDFLERELAASLGMVPPLFALSARQGLRARLDDDEAGWQASGMAAFAAALNAFLRTESRALWVSSMMRRLGALLAESGFAVEVEIKALDAPKEAIEGARGTLTQGRERLRQGLAYFTAALEYERRRVLREHVEPGLEAFAKALRVQLHTELDVLVREPRRESTGTLRERLADHTERAIRQACDAWRGEEIQHTEEVFDQAAVALWDDLSGEIDELMRVCARWLGIALQLPALHIAVERSPAFHYKFWEAPPSLYLLSQRLASLVPGWPGRVLALRHARSRADDLASMHAGRMRHDLDERLKARAQHWLGRATEYLQGRMASAEAALASGVQAQSSQDDTRVRRERLRDELAEIRALEAIVLSFGTGES